MSEYYSDYGIIVIPREQITLTSAISTNGVDYIKSLPPLVHSRALDNLNNKGVIIYNPNIREWQRIEPEKVEAKISIIIQALKSNKKNNHTVDDPKPVMQLSNIAAEIADSCKLKPEDLIISDRKWKFLVRSILRSKNIIMTGDSGMGKTVAAISASKSLSRDYFIFNCGSSQDPRAMLIGNTQFNKESGTFFAESRFVHAIQQENSVIILDELSRANGEAWNILMPVLDINQRTLQLDEKPGSPVIKVHPSVTFIATANIGFQYTATRVMDRALTDRFTIIEMDALTQSEELKLLKLKSPNVDVKMLDTITSITSDIRRELKTEVPKCSTQVSTRVAIEIASLLEDGFTLLEAIEESIYPLYSDEGGAGSERTFVKQLVQKYIVDDSIPDLLI